MCVSISQAIIASWYDLIILGPVGDPSYKQGFHLNSKNLQKHAPQLQPCCCYVCQFSHDTVSSTMRHQATHPVRDDYSGSYLFRTDRNVAGKSKNVWSNSTDVSGVYCFSRSSPGPRRKPNIAVEKAGPSGECWPLCILGTPRSPVTSPRKVSIYRSREMFFHCFKI